MGEGVRPQKPHRIDEAALHFDSHLASPGACRSNVSTLLAPNPSLPYTVPLRWNPMARALKTQATNAPVEDFLDRIENDQVRDDCWAVVKIMEKATNAKPRMWGASIVGFGSCRYKYPDGHEMDWMLAAFSPRKQNITLYIMPGFEEYGDLMARLGKHSCGKSCLYIKRLSDCTRTDADEACQRVGQTHAHGARNVWRVNGRRRLT